MKFPYSRPFLSSIDKNKILSALDNQYLTQGPIVEKFEEKLSILFNVKHAITCNSGTSALHMLYAGLGVGPKVGIITTPITFLATANAARFCNAPIAFSDVDPITGNITLESIKKTINSVSFKVKAISVVHLGGRPCEMVKIKEYADKIGVYIVEDACHAPLARYSDKAGVHYKVGSCSHSIAATLSFHAIKHVTTGEGGVLLTNNDELADFAKKFKSHGVIKDKSLMKNKDEKSNPWYYEMSNLGYNYRLSDINCAIGLAQLKNLKKNLERRNELAEMYHKNLAEVAGIILPSLIDKTDGLHAWHLFPLIIDFEKFIFDRKSLIFKLIKQGIGTQVHYIPLYKQPYYRKFKYKFQYDGAEKFYSKTLSIPMYFGLKNYDIQKISKVLIKIFEQNLKC